MDAAIDREVARQAAYWLMLLHSGDANARQVRDCERWRQANPEHERAWQRVRLVQERLGLLPPSLAMSALGRERRQALKTLLVLAMIAPLGLATYRLNERQQWLADQRSGVGERRELKLADGSRVYLNSGSAIDIRFDEQQRLIVLRRGEVLIESGKDPAYAGQPLRVETGQGRLQALGTRFSVRRLDERALTHLAVFEGAVRVDPLRGKGVTIVAGQQVRFSQQEAGTASSVSEDAAAWIRGQLVADGMPLREFLAELGRYRAGWLRCTPEVKNLRISGTFQLDQSDAILAALPVTLPVRVERRTTYWVTVRGH
ncbi:FecR family protein [Pseudomonas flavescens]|uniref:FecR family protein n=1 Tax=Phytopseudomonas flavescens TaxID=29435 RepID=A0A1G8DYR8_9GAMM|nr:FecR domain-containing protein [Pseudomonas flavescens]SDH62620.1 FecR family protein [Pseudomonas flavescens]